MKKMIIKRKIRQSGPQNLLNAQEAIKSSTNGSQCHFLESRIPFLSKQKKSVIPRDSKQGNLLSEKKEQSSLIAASFNPASENIGDYRKDAATLSRTMLKEKYQSTYDSWRNMVQRQLHGAKIASEFREFKSFLVHMGPRPQNAVGNYTLDRLDNNNPKYGPGLCQWRDKAQQANNRSCTIFLEYKGELHPLVTWAARTNQLPDTLRDRKKRGWSDAEIIEGKRKNGLSREAKEELFFSLVWPDTYPNYEKIRRFWERQYNIAKLTSHQKSSRRGFLYSILRNEESKIGKWIKDNYVDEDDPSQSKDDIYLRKEEYLKGIKETLKRIDGIR